MIRRKPKPKVLMRFITQPLIQWFVIHSPLSPHLKKRSEHKVHELPGITWTRIKFSSDSPLIVRVQFSSVSPSVVTDCQYYSKSIPVLWKAIPFNSWFWIAFGVQYHRRDELCFASQYDNSCNNSDRDSTQELTSIFYWNLKLESILKPKPLFEWLSSASNCYITDYCVERKPPENWSSILLRIRSQINIFGGVFAILKPVLESDPD